MKKWKAYYERVGEKPNSLVVETLKDFVVSRSVALDLGAGNLRDSKFILEQGFTRVIAVDASKESLAFQTNNIELYIMPIQRFTPQKESLDFVSCCNTLFFLTSEQIAEVIQNVKKGLRSGGIFVCNVLGKDDGWVLDGRPVSSFTKDTLISIFQGFNIKETSEGRHTSKTLNEHGFEVSKFWHQLSIVVEKP